VKTVPRARGGGAALPVVAGEAPRAVVAAAASLAGADRSEAAGRPRRAVPRPATPRGWRRHPRARSTPAAPRVPEEGAGGARAGGRHAGAHALSPALPRRVRRAAPRDA
jgi:hypothetical protein